MQDLKTKINKKLRSILANNSREFDNLKQIKIYLIIINNAYKYIKIDNNSNSL